LAVESFYGGAYAYVGRQFGSLHDWARDFVPRFRNASGLVLYFQVSSVEDETFDSPEKMLGNETLQAHTGVRLTHTYKKLAYRVRWLRLHFLLCCHLQPS
jgi:hypothetical protein